MSILGLVVFALAIAGLWLCLPGESAAVKPFLRGGRDVFAAIGITTGFVIGILIFAIGVAA